MASLLFLAACGGTVITGDGGATDGATDSTIGTDASTCTYKETRTNSDRLCMSADDCTLVIRSVTCCEEQHEGIRKDAAMRFQNEQAMLIAGCPGCGCNAQPIDDLGMKGTMAFTVRCDMGLCTSHAQ